MGVAESATPEPGDGPDPQPPADMMAAAEQIFGEHLPTAVGYAGLLVTDAVVRGLIGPREAPRIWERHLLNCAVVAEIIPEGLRIVDVGSGAGLPGIAIAIARPDLSVTLLEPLGRRTSFLAEAVQSLGLAGVTVVRARAEERGRDERELADVATARALAPLDRLAAWCLPLVVVGGRVLALKGDSAANEIEAHRAAIARLGGARPVIRTCGVAVLEAPTVVVEITRDRRLSGAKVGVERRKPGRRRHA